MGNTFTVRNDSSEDVICEVYPVGLMSAAIVKSIPVNMTEKFKFRNSLCKTFIVSIPNKATRAMSKYRRACLKQVSCGEFIITVEDLGTQISASSKEIMECFEIDINWNIVQSKAKENAARGFTENLGLMMALNKHVSSVIGMIGGLVVAEASGSKEASRIAIKMSTEFFENYLKISVSHLSRQEDPAVINKINEIYQTLVALSRNLSREYPYFKQSLANDGRTCLIHLFELLSKITTSNILPFLEQCGLEVAVPIYIFGVTIILDIIDKIREISTNESEEVEKIFAEVFINNLKDMWNTVLENIRPNTKVEIQGCLVKKAVLRYDGELIYRVKSIFRNRAITRIENIKEEFIKNRNYQLNFLYDHPLDFFKRFEERHGH